MAAMMARRQTKIRRRWTRRPTPRPTRPSRQGWRSRMPAPYPPYAAHLHPDATGGEGYLHEAKLDGSTGLRRGHQRTSPAVVPSCGWAGP